MGPLINRKNKDETEKKMNISHLRAYSLCLVTGQPHVGRDKETVWLLNKIEY